LIISSLSGWALSPALPPSGNFDLSHWKLTLPVDSNGANIGTAAEVQVAQMVAGYTNASYFYTASDGAMLFWCPVDGATTSGSTYPRSELREMLSPGSTSVNWMGYGTHLLTAQCKLTQIPSSKKVIIGQIHSFTGNAYPLLKLQYNNGNIEALFKFSPNSHVDTKYTVATGIALSNSINYQIKMVNGLLTATVNGNTQGTNIFLTDPAWTNQTFYFKAGNYCQDNVGAIPEGASVSFYELTASHATNAPAVTNQPVSLAIRAGSNATFTVGATGTPLAYRWRFNNTNIANATNSSLTLTNAQATNVGDYSVLITNAAGSVTSSIARLYLDSPLRIINWTITNKTNCSFTLIGSRSSNYVIETSPDLFNWTPLLTNNSPSGLLPFTDIISPANNNLFYRARTP
jgi:hypothetical protein